MILPTRLTDACWKRGRLKYKLKPYQLPMYDAIWNCINGNKKSHCLLVSRRKGKTYVEMLISIEFGIRYPSSQIKFGGPYQEQLMESVEFTIGNIIDDAPDFIKPRLTSKDTLEIPNGSQVKFAGVDVNAKGLRGGNAHLAFLDESGFMKDLNGVYTSIIGPQLDTTDGSLIFSSSASESMDHDFFDIVREHREENNITEMTIYDGNSHSQEQLDEIITRCGGINSTAFRREYLNQFVTEQDRALCSEWTVMDPETEDLKFPYEYDLPKDEFYQYWHKYVVIDPGVNDLTAVTFWYYNFNKGIFQCEDEFHINGPEMTTAIVAEMIKAKIKELWGHIAPQLNQGDVVYRYIADSNNKQLVNDLRITYKLPFSSTDKGELDAMVNKVKVWTTSNKIAISPKCKMTIGCLRYGVWEKNKRGSLFGHSKVYGHYDHFATVVYAVRNVDEYTNPVPRMFGVNFYSHANTHLINENDTAWILTPTKIIYYPYVVFLY